MVQRQLIKLLRGAQPLSVLVVEVVEGAGVEGNPLRPVKYYLDCETGAVLARVDDCADETAEVDIRPIPTVVEED